MGSGVDLNLIFLKADEMYDKSRPGFIHALRKPQGRKGWTELTFPSGLICTTNSSPVETELTYNEVFEGREYLRSGIELSDHDTIIDVGANIGMFTMYLLTNLDGPTIHAIEPVPDTFEVLRQNVERYRNGNVCVHNTALGAIPDSSMDIVFFPLLTGNSTAHPEIKEVQREAISKVFTPEELVYIYTEKRIKVPSTTLSCVIRKTGIDRIDLLKIDTEGSEVDILNGIEAGHWPLVRQLAMEVHNEKSVLPRLIEVLSSHGMKPIIDEASRDPFGTVVITATRR